MNKRPITPSNKSVPRTLSTGDAAFWCVSSKTKYFSTIESPLIGVFYSLPHISSVCTLQTLQFHIQTLQVDLLSRGCRPQGVQVCLENMQPFCPAILLLETYSKEIT